MKLMDLFEFMPKSKFSASYGSDKGNYPFFTSSNTIDKYCDDFIYDGEFLIIGDGGTGNCKHYNGKFSVSDHNYVLKPKSQTNALAVKYFLEKDNYQILNDGFKGIGIKNVSKSYIQNIDYKYNHHFSQNEIVKNLVLIEKNIEREKQSINSLDCLIKSRFNEMFSNLDDYVTVQDSCEVHARIGWQALTQKEHMKTGKYMLITGTDFKDNEINYSSCVFVTKERYEMDRHIILRNDDVLITKDGTIGKVAIVHNLPGPATLNSGVFVLRPDNRFNKEYISYVFKGEPFSRFVEEVKTGVTVKHLNQANLLKFKIPVPKKKAQEHFALFLKTIDKLKFNCQQRIKLYQELLDKKMDEYFG